jgi:hypothetical protein
MRVANRITLIVVIMLLVACGASTRDQVIKDSYRALSVGGQAYDLGMTGVATLHRNGQVGDEVKTEAITVGKYYYDAYHTAVEGLALYAETEGEQGDIQLLMLEVGKQLGKFLAYVNPILIKYGMEEVQ